MSHTLPPLDLSGLPISRTISNFVFSGKTPILDGRAHFPEDGIAGLFLRKNHRQMTAEELRFYRILPDVSIVYTGRGKYDTVNNRLGVLLHEIGHAACYKSGCECVQEQEILVDDPDIAEVHADTFALIVMLQEGHAKALRNWMLFIMDWLAQRRNPSMSELDWRRRYANSVVTINSPIWDKCAAAIGLHDNVRGIRRTVLREYEDLKTFDEEMGETL